MGRTPCCDKTIVKRGPWSLEEDTLLKNFIEAHGTGGNWIALPQKAGLNRCGKSCRLRWLNYLRPNIKHGGFTVEEDYIISTLFSAIGSRWSVIASKLPGRTDNDVKNYWNTKLKKRLMPAKLTAFDATAHNNPTCIELNPTLKPEFNAYNHGYYSLDSCNRVPSHQSWDTLYNETMSGQLELPPLSTCSSIGDFGGGEDDIDEFWLRLLVDQSTFFGGSSQISTRVHHENINGFDSVLDDPFSPSVF